MKYNETNIKCSMLASIAENRTELDRLEDILDADMQAVALAAPQIGWNVAVFAVRRQKGIGGLYINPQYESKSVEMVKNYEGCRSLPNDPPVLVKRYKSVQIVYLDASGNEHKRTFHGYAARIVQHEMDHLEGKMLHE